MFKSRKAAFLEHLRWFWYWNTHVGAPPHSSDVMMHTYTKILAALPKHKTASAWLVRSYTVRLWNALTAGIWAHPSALQCNSSFFDGKRDCGLCKCLLGLTCFHETITAPSYTIIHVGTWATMHGFSSDSLPWSTSLISAIYSFKHQKTQQPITAQLKVLPRRLDPELNSVVCRLGGENKVCI